jgi:hypothetical protein
LRNHATVGGGWLVLRWTGNLTHVFAMIALGLFVFGSVIALAVKRGVWFSDHDNRAASR